MFTLKKLITDCFTENDGVHWCMVRIGSVPVVTVMLGKFVVATGEPNYLGLAGGIAAIWASIAFKNKTEDKPKEVS